MIESRYLLLIVVDLIYAHFLNKEAKTKRRIVFNGYWENKKLSAQRPRKSIDALFKKHKRSGFFIFHAFLMKRNKSPASRLVYVYIFV